MFPETITTPRLQLRPPKMEDADAIFHRYARDPEVTRYLRWRPNKDVSETRAFLSDVLAKRAALADVLWLIERRADALLLGAVGLRLSGHMAELGYCLARDAWGAGYMTEAATTIVETAIHAPNIQRVWASCDVENRASARVLEKSGMRFEGAPRRFSILPNLSETARDALLYARVIDAPA